VGVTTASEVKSPSQVKNHDVVIVGGFGHVGLPLGISLAHHGKTVCALDINPDTGKLIAQGTMPFLDDGAEELLRPCLESGRLTLSLDSSVIAGADTVIVVIGTPVDEHLNPEFEMMRRMLEGYLEYFRDGQLVVLRSTVYPGTTERLDRWFRERGKSVEVAYCPERIAEGFAIRELESLPQIVSAFSEDGIRRCTELFQTLTHETVPLRPVEAELAKLFNNTWRYIKFATANQFYMIANDHDADFYRIYHAMTHNYPRARDFPKPGFAAGPCLFKDAMQLAAFNNNSFYLGHAAMLINEGLPNYLVDRLRARCDLRSATVGILGMAFKGDSDDKRESLSYKLRKILSFESREVLCTDPYIQDGTFVGLEELLHRSDIVILAAPHSEYRDLRLPAGENQVVVDVWNIWENGCVL
jgi:UDP-N-acetyl-D-mannosaminuronic acid dehydrogenase